jgi:hypothetical protein
MTWAEKTLILALMDRTKADIALKNLPDGYNIDIKIGKAAALNNQMNTVNRVKCWHD